MAKRCDALLPLELLNMIDLLFVHAKSRIDVLNIVNSNENDGAFGEAHDEELFTVLTWMFI